MPTSKLRILFAADVHPNPNSGAAGTEYRTIQSLRRLGCEVDEIWADDLLRRIDHGNLHYLLELPRSYRKAIRRRWTEKSYDVVHVNQAQCYLAALEHGVKKRPGVFVYRSHGLEDRAEQVLKPLREKLGIKKRGAFRSIPGYFLENLLNRHYRMAARHSSGIIVSCTLDRDYLVNNHNVVADRVGVIPQAAANVFLNSSSASFSPERLWRILHIGNFVHWKGAYDVAEAANVLLSRNSRATLTWVCRGADHFKVREILSPEANRKTRLVEWGAQESLLSIYDNHGILLCPSLFEGFGKVFLEGMARGLLVVTTPTGGMKDIVEHGRNGFIVNFCSFRDIISVVRHLWTNIGFAESVSRKAREKAEEFTWDRTAKETMEFYERLIRLSKV